jgi:hypothetical protein
MRQVIHVNDIMVYFNKKERQSYKMIADIKKYYNKQAFQPIIIKDFADYYNISQESIIEVMNTNDQLKNQQLEAVKQVKIEEAATQKRLKEDKEQQILDKLDKIENKPKQFTYKTN